VRKSRGGGRTLVTVSRHPEVGLSRSAIKVKNIILHSGLKQVEKKAAWPALVPHARLFSKVS
jgi:hypothetical protein